jgi:hypothetical protein
MEFKLPILRKKKPVERRGSTSPLDKRVREGEESDPWRRPPKIKKVKDATAQRIDMWMFSMITLIVGFVLLVIWLPVGAGVVGVGIGGFVAYLLE